MTKQILSKEVEGYVKNNPKCILLDVRTEEEWNIDGKPDGEKIALKTHFITIQFADKTFNQNFIEDFKKLNIEKDQEILAMCMGCLLYTSPSPRDRTRSRMPSSA